jgi:hypothetical protein
MLLYRCRDKDQVNPAGNRRPQKAELRRPRA